MALYNSFKYNDGTLYGDGSPLDYSASPVVATAINYGQVSLSYSVPTGGYIKFRIVRNQDGYPETSEDGKIIYETDLGEYPTGSTILDTNLVLGRFVYYRVWIQRTANSYWEPAGDAITLMPLKHTLTSGNNVVKSVTGSNGVTYDSPIADDVEFSTTHKRFMSYFPAVLTSMSLSPLDEINTNYSYIEPTGYQENSLISRFFEGFSFSIDEFLTFAKIIVPDVSGANSSPSIIGLKSFELGIKPYNELAIKAQKRLVRDAVAIYSKKGTIDGLTLFVKDLTGYKTQITETTNLMLSYEESTFKIESWDSGDPIGSWIAGDGVTLEVSTNTPPSLTNSLDTVYSLKAVATGASQYIAYGINKPITDAIPVIQNSNYSLSFYCKGPSNLTMTITWHDRLGNSISTSSNSATVSSSAFQRHQVQANSPTGSVYASFKLEFASTGSATYYFDSFQFEPAIPATEYYEPRGVLVSLLPDKINFIKNPSFEVDSAGVPISWTFTNLTAVKVESSLDEAPGSEHMVKITTPGSFPSGQGVISSTYTGTAPTSNFYTFSVYARSLTGDQVVTLELNANSVPSNVFSYAEATLTSEWQRISVSIYSPNIPGQLVAKIKTLVPNAVFYLDSAQLEEGSSATDYFDGDRTYDGSVWFDTANPGASISGHYSNRDQRIAHLMDSIKEYLPVGTPYYVTFYGSDTYTEVALSGIA
jgi:hypothetical protein